MAHYIDKDKTFPLRERIIPATQRQRIPHETQRERIPKETERDIFLRHRKHNTMSKSLHQFEWGKTPMKEHDVSFGESQFPIEDLLEETLPDSFAEFRGGISRASTPVAPSEPLHYVEPDSSEFHPEQFRPKISTPVPSILISQELTPPFPDLSPINQEEISFGYELSQMVLPGEAMTPDYSRDSHGTFHSSKAGSVGTPISRTSGSPIQMQNRSFSQTPSETLEPSSLAATVPMIPGKIPGTSSGSPIQMHNRSFSQTSSETLEPSSLAATVPRTSGSPIQMHNRSFSQTPSETLEPSSLAATVPRTSGSPIQMHNRSFYQTPSETFEPSVLADTVPRIDSTGHSTFGRDATQVPQLTSSLVPSVYPKDFSYEQFSPIVLHVEDHKPFYHYRDRHGNSYSYIEGSVGTPISRTPGSPIQMHKHLFSQIPSDSLELSPFAATVPRIASTPYAALDPAKLSFEREEISKISRSPIQMRKHSLSKTPLDAMEASSITGAFQEQVRSGESGTPEDLYDTTLRAGLYPETVSILSEEDRFQQPVLETLRSFQSSALETEVKRPRTPSVVDTSAIDTSSISEEEVELDSLEVQRNIRDYEYMRKELNRIVASFHAEGTFVELQAPDRLLRALKCILEDLHDIAKEKERNLPEPINQKSLKSDNEINFDDSLIVERSDILEFQEEAYAIDEDLLRLSANVEVLYAQAAPPFSEPDRDIMRFRAEYEKLLHLNRSLKDKFHNEDSRYYHYLNLNFIAYAKTISPDYDVAAGQERILHVMTRHIIDHALTYYPETMMPTDEIAWKLFQDWAEWLEKFKEDPEQELNDINDLQNRIATKNQDLYWRNIGYKIQHLEPLLERYKEVEQIYNEECERSIKRRADKQEYIKKTEQYKKQIHQLEAMCELAAQYYVGFAENWAKLREQNNDARVLLGINEPKIHYQRYGEMGTSFHSEDMPMESDRSFDIELPSWLFHESPADRPGFINDLSLSYPPEGMSGSNTSSSSSSYVVRPVMQPTPSPQLSDIPSP